MKHMYGLLYKPTTIMRRHKHYDTKKITWREEPWTYKVATSFGLYAGVIFLGYRYVVEGTVVGHPEDGPYIIESRRIKVALVSYDPRCNPVYVLPESLQEI